MVVIPIVLTLALMSGAILIFVDAEMLGLMPNIHTIPVEQEPLLNFELLNIEFPETDTVLIYQLESGRHVVILPEEMNSRFEGFNLTEDQVSLDILLVPEVFVEQAILFSEYEWVLQMGVVLLLVIFAVLVNYILTKFVFKPIASSLNILTEGVDEISDGNLSYRLKHDMGNEFDAVGANFNEMANRLHDMVEQRKIDEQNRKELIAGIAHDLRTPLTSIRTYAEGLEMGMATTPEIQEKYLSTIKNKTKDMEHILNQLFMFSKLDIGEFPMRLDKWDAGGWLADFVQHIHDEYLEKGLRVELGKNVAKTYFLIDSVQLGNVLTNVLENSVKYGNAKEPQMMINCELDDEQVVITMTDNGVGVSEMSVDKLFDVFYRSDKARTNPSGGSGLGLAISAKIINRMGGSIKAENANDGGLTILIKLPVVKGDNV